MHNPAAGQRRRAWPGDYCYGIEMQRTLARPHVHEASVIPILLRAVDWHGAPFGHLQALPICSVI